MTVQLCECEVKILPSKDLFSKTSPSGVLMYAPLGTMATSSSILATTAARRSSSFISICRKTPFGGGGGGGG